MRVPQEILSLHSSFLEGKENEMLERTRCSHEDEEMVFPILKAQLSFSPSFRPAFNVCNADNQKLAWHPHSTRCMHNQLFLRAGDGHLRDRP